MTTTSACTRFPPFGITPQERQGAAMAKARPAELWFGLREEQIEFFWSYGYVSLDGLRCIGSQGNV